MTPSASYILMCFLIAVTAVVYSYVLTKPGEIFGGLYGKLYRLFNDVRQWTGEGDHPLFKMLIGCFKCVAGQWAFWIYLLYAWSSYTWWTIIPHILFVGLTIFLSLIVYKIIKHIE